MKLIIEIDGEEQTVELPEATFRVLREIAERNDLTIEAALTQSIENEKFIEDQLEHGKLLVERGDGLRMLELA